MFSPKKKREVLTATGLKVTLLVDEVATEPGSSYLSSQSADTPRFAEKRGFTRKAVQRGAGERIPKPPSAFPEGKGLRVPMG